MDITVEDQPARLVAVLRERVAVDALAAFYARAYATVAQQVAAAGLSITGPAFGWYHDMPTDSVDLAAGFQVGAESVGTLGGGVEVVELPGGPSAVGVHVGTYDDLPEAWAEVQAWTSCNAVVMRGGFLEVYLSDPTEVAEPSLNRTRLVLPIVR